ncbi:rRNA maturation RNase YbeY [Croceitalea sp. MTPC9]|uniref:rRNA maturation RNase YbeY n=1 Tax=unclassified Croceitalea TaxID=2632280 RepID=UPI002B3DD47A|nr:rRNA maturation RNase YbeY [Croceitalea sp. MTPC6]GMN16620.1 rRNA maturation RNase YbeY [Croceitalea sp. MTPC9]
MKIEFNYEIDFKLVNESKYTDWINKLIQSQDSYLGNLSYIFCDDAYLLDINLQYLNHDTLTDIITFNYSDENTISGDIFISIERVKDNAKIFKVDFKEELLRVMSHGVLHLLGFNDKTESDKQLMRSKENEMMRLFHVEQ